MSKKLLFGRTKKILLFVTLLFGVAASGVFGQSFQPGDIAIVTVNSEENDSEEKIFDFVPLIDIENGTTLKFTDAAYDNNNNELKTNEGTITYTAPTDISAGSVITYPGQDENGFTTSGSFDPSTQGDNIIVFQGEKGDSPTYLLGVGWARGSSVWEDDPDNNRSAIPPNLSEEDNTILSLGTAENLQYDTSNKWEGTANSLLASIANESNWNEKDENPFPPLETSFTLLSPPTVAFASASLSKEEGSTVNLIVELVESNNTAVDVDVVFLNSSSTAVASDVDEFTEQTVSFSGADDNGATKTVQIALANDSDFEGSKEAVFQLQNNSTGSIISPEVITLTITDNDVPDIVINEFLADPDGEETNNDGNQDNTDDEFIEIVNNESADIDISNWTISDEGDVQFTFPSGTVIPAENAAVVFAGGSPSGGFGGALVFTTSGLSLNNDGDTITLADDEGNLINEISYSSITPGVSLNRDPDGTGSDESFVDHTAITGSSTDYTPGTRVDGTSFSSDHAIAIRGTEGWRMISSPVQNATFEDFFSAFWMQGITGSNDPGGEGTLFSWNEADGGAFATPNNMTEPMTVGKGYIVYVFEDDEFNTPGIQGGFPKIIDSDGDENTGSISVPVSANDEGGTTDIDGEEGWNLLGNPFDTDLSVAAVLDELESVNSSVNGNIYVWDHEADEGNGDWVVLTDGDTIAPFQAFFVRFTSAFSDNASLDKSSLEANEGKEFYKDVNENFTFDLELHGEQYFDTYSLEFSENGTTELDRYDAYKLFSLNPNSINLYSTQNNNRLQKNVLPRELESNLEIPLSFDASGRTSLTFRWGSFENIPDEWDFILIDNELNREIDLRSNDKYEFSTNTDSEVNDLANPSSNNSLLKTAKQDDGEPRFTLAVQPQIAGSDESEIPESVKLNPNYPNPFNPSTTVSFELTEDSEVTLSIWNMIGQKVATLVEGVVEAGTHQQTWNASNMPSGMYIARLEVGGEVFIRKMTLIK